MSMIYLLAYLVISCLAAVAVGTFIAKGSE